MAGPRRNTASRAHDPGAYPREVLIGPGYTVPVIDAFEQTSLFR